MNRVTCDTSPVLQAYRGLRAVHPQEFRTAEVVYETQLTGVSYSFALVGAPMLILTPPDSVLNPVSLLRRTQTTVVEYSSKALVLRVSSSGGHFPLLSCLQLDSF